jgi:hypothetical protein
LKSEKNLELPASPASAAFRRFDRKGSSRGAFSVLVLFFLTSILIDLPQPRYLYFLHHIWCAQISPPNAIPPADNVNDTKLGGTKTISMQSVFIISQCAIAFLTRKFYGGNS